MTTTALSAFAWVFIGIPVLIIWALGVYDILKRHLPRGQTAAWLLIVLILPVLGTLLYWILRKPSREEIRLAGDATVETPRDQLGRVGPPPPLD
jgi:hypothetical protein